MHAVYMFQHSRHGDAELRWSLRSLERHAPWIEKVWILGDRPSWLIEDGSIVEHVSHAAVAWIPNLTLPVRNTFLLMLLAAIHPRLPAEFLWLCDDYVLLDDLSPDQARIARYVEDLDTQSANRGTGLYKEALWRTYDLLVARGLPRLNFETHVPLVLTKERIVSAASEFRVELSQERYGGPLAQLAVMNLALRRERFVPRLLAEEGRYAGFHYREPSPEDVANGVAGKRFLNFDDDAFGPALRALLAERFPERSRFERTTDGLAKRGLEPADCVILVCDMDRLSPASDAALRRLEEAGYFVCRGGSWGARERNRLIVQGLRTHREGLLWLDGKDEVLESEIDRVRREGPLACGGEMSRIEEGRSGDEQADQPERSMAGWLWLRREVVLAIIRAERLTVLEVGSTSERLPLFREDGADEVDPAASAERLLRRAGYPADFGSGLAKQV